MSSTDNKSDTPAETIPAVLYAAKSTEDEHGSIASQLVSIRDSVSAELDRGAIGEFSDEAASAYSGSRGPGLAAAIEAAREAAAEHGTAELWCADADRLARGDGRRARHLGGLYFELLADNIATAGSGRRRRPARRDPRRAPRERNHQDSAAKSGHASPWHPASCCREGRWRGGSLPDGYDVIHTVDERGGRRAAPTARARSAGRLTAGA